MRRIGIPFPVFVFVLLLVATACEQPYVGTTTTSSSTSSSPEETDANVFLHILPTPSTMMSLAVFRGGTKWKTFHNALSPYTACDVAIYVPEGESYLALVGHCSEGVPTFTSMEKIAFKNNIATDTYLFTGQLLMDSLPLRDTLTMEHVAARIAVSIPDTLPEGTSLLKFYYTGGSSTLSATTGYGSVNSRQTVKLSPSSSQRYALYTFPHQQQDTLKLVVTALDAAGGTIQEHTLTSIPVQRDCVTNVFFSYATGACRYTSPKREDSSTWGDPYEYSY